MKFFTLKDHMKVARHVKLMGQGKARLIDMGACCTWCGSRAVLLQRCVVSTDYSVQKWLWNSDCGSFPTLRTPKGF